MCKNQHKKDVQYNILKGGVTRRLNQSQNEIRVHKAFQILLSAPDEISVTSKTFFFNSL